MISILWKIRQAGGKILVDAGRVRIDVPIGVLSDSDKQVLGDHKQDLVRLLAPAETVVVDAEREAIQWVETLSPTQADEVVATALREWREIVEETTQAMGRDDDQDDAEVVDWEEAIDPFEPCPSCGSLLQWESTAGTWQCLSCEPPTRAKRLRARARRLWQMAADRGKDPAVPMYGRRIDRGGGGWYESEN
ncbi:MAG: hypothetical protein HUU20_23590 [Pirellulales bacterium]|nr:hypothetical protein [Pirellulales bacterium]